MFFDMTYEEALEKAGHLKALGETTVYLRDGSSKPWMVAKTVEAGSGYRLNGPSSMYVIAEVEGLTFKWNIDFEGRDANGRGVSLFDRERLREVAMKLPLPARRAFAKLLAETVLPGIEKRTAEVREALNQQLDSEDCVRGLIAFAEQRDAA